MKTKGKTVFYTVVGTIEGCDWHAMIPDAGWNTCLAKTRAEAKEWKRQRALYTHESIVLHVAKVVLDD